MILFASKFRWFQRDRSDIGFGRHFFVWPADVFSMQKSFHKSQIRERKKIFAFFSLIFSFARSSSCRHSLPLHFGITCVWSIGDGRRIYCHFFPFQLKNSQSEEFVGSWWTGKYEQKTLCVSNGEVSLWRKRIVSGSRRLVAAIREPANGYSGQRISRRTFVEIIDGPNLKSALCIDVKHAELQLLCVRVRAVSVLSLLHFNWIASAKRMSLQSMR